MGVYGNFLNSWSELFEFYDIYEVSPKVEAGYHIHFWKRVRGVMLTATKDQLISKHGLVEIDTIHTLYTNEELHLKNKMLKYHNQWYRAIKDGTWNKEGAFCITQFQQVEGNVELEAEHRVGDDVIQGQF